MYSTSIDFYGHDGPIEVNTSVVPILDLWLEAGLELGYDIHDPNGFQREGNSLFFYLLLSLLVRRI